MFEHLVFYDGQCGLCDRVVQFLLRVDKNRLFVFAPLQGETAKTMLKELPSKYKNLDSLVLIQDFKSTHKKYYILGVGALRIAWLLGGLWTVIGVLNFLPGFVYNWAYLIVAKNRHRFFPMTHCRLPDPLQKDRFLP